MDKVIKPKRQYTRKKLLKNDELTIHIVDQAESEPNVTNEVDKNEIIIKYPDINNLEHFDLKNQIFKILNGQF